MSKSVCEPDRKNYLICELCSKGDNSRYFFALSARALSRHGKDHEKDFVICNHCLKNLNEYIEEIRHNEHYYEHRCYRLEKQIEINEKGVKKLGPGQLLITNERFGEMIIPCIREKVEQK